MSGKLNLDIPASVSELEAMMSKVLPKKVFYRLLLRGKGLEFDGYRSYTPDEDASSIDWKASMRANNLIVKQYIEERDIKVMFVIDVGENMVFGSTEKLKCEYSAELAAAMAHLIINAGDKVGFLLFNTEIARFSLPIPGKRQFDVFTFELGNAENYKGVADMNVMFDSVMEMLDPSITMVFFISDFIKVDESMKKKIEEFGHLYETIAVMIRDPLDKTFPDVNKEVVIENPNTGEKLIINPKLAKKIYERNAEKQINLVKEMFKNGGIDCLELVTNERFSVNLANFLKSRTERRGY